MTQLPHNSSTRKEKSFQEEKNLRNKVPLKDHYSKLVRAQRLISPPKTHQKQETCKLDPTW